MIEPGAVHQVAVAIRDDEGALTNPGTATLTVTLPDGSTETPAVTLPPADTGIVRVDFTPSVGGLHRWRLVTTGPTTARSDVFNVVEDSWPALVGLAETKDHLNIPQTDTSQDDELRGFILSASAVVEDIVGICAKREIVETNSGGGRHIVLTHSPVDSVTSVVIDGETVDSGDYTASPSGMVARRSGVWPAGLHNVTVTYVAGRPIVPANVIDAAKELVRVNFRPQQGGNYSAFDGGGNDDFGAGAMESSLQGNLRLGFFVPNAVTQRLQPNQRGPVVL